MAYISICPFISHLSLIKDNISSLRNSYIYMVTHWIQCSISALYKHAHIPIFQSFTSEIYVVENASIDISHLTLQTKKTNKIQLLDLLHIVKPLRCNIYWISNILAIFIKKWNREIERPWGGVVKELSSGRKDDESDIDITKSTQLLSLLK